MFYYACGLGESGLVYIYMLIIVPKVLSSMNVLVPVLVPNVRKPLCTLQYDPVVDVPHIQSVYYLVLEEYALPTSTANSYY
jgi:hypothetical protein